MKGETPSWLEDSSSSGAEPTVTATSSMTAPASAPPPASFSLTEAPVSSSKTPTDNVAGSILSSINNRSVAAPVSTVDESDLPRTILFLRVLNLAAAALLIACSIVEMVSIPGVSVWVMAIYATCGGLLVCCLETQLKFIRITIAMNFGFLFHSVYRFIFYCLMASVAWSYGGLLGRITAIVLLVVALFNTYVLCRYPTYRKMREKIAEEEDRKIEAKINQQVRKQAMRTFTG